jgi:hypothetical protein
VSANEKLVIFHLKDTIFTLSQNVAIGLTIHSFWPKCGSNEVNFFTSKLFLEWLRKFEALNFNQSILLRTDTFTLASVVVSAWLSIEGWEDGVAFAKLDFLCGSQGVELPSDEGVIEGVHLCGDEGAAPVHKHTEFLQILLSLGWEELEPVFGVLELRDLLISDADLLQNFELSKGLSLLSLGLAWLNLTAKAASSCVDGHTCAMEGKREKHILAQLFLVADLEFAFRHRISMSYIILIKNLSVSIY